MTIGFIILSAVLLASALGVVFFKDAIYSALCLIVHLVGIACCFAGLNAHFLAVVQMIVYAGAIMVLILFVLMLLNIKKEEFGIGQYIQFLIATCLSIWFLSLVIPEIVNTWPVKLLDEEMITGSVSAIGKVLYVKHLLPFEASGLLLMAALVSATMLAKANYGKKQRTAKEGQQQEKA